MKKCIFDLPSLRKIIIKNFDTYQTHDDGTIETFHTDNVEWVVVSLLKENFLNNHLKSSCQGTDEDEEDT